MTQQYRFTEAGGSAKPNAGGPRFTEAEFTEAMKAAVAERGEDYVYPYEECEYVDINGRPLCLIGTAVFHLDPEAAADLDDMYADSALLGLVSPQVARAARAAQLFQDGGTFGDHDKRKPWGEALAVYLDKVANSEPDSDSE